MKAFQWYQVKTVRKTHRSSSLRNRSHRSSRRRLTRHRADSRLAQITRHAVQEPRIRIHLRHIPDHNAPKTAKTLRVSNHGRQRTSSLVTGSGTGISRYPEQDFDIRVLGHGFRPVIPGSEVKVILGRGTSDEGLHAAVIVVELDKDGIERDRAVEHGVICCVRVRALRSSGQEVGAAGRSAHEGAELAGEGRHVADGALEVEVEAVDDCVSKGAGHVGAGLGTEDGPEVLGGAGCGRGAGEAAFRVGCSSDGEQDGFAVLGLAVGYVLSVKKVRF